MTVELWIALFAALAIGATVGFVFAKRNAPKKSELDALRDQLHAAQTETAEIREGVSDHFEQSAVLFGRLAQDYRSFIEHFSESAQTLGISEGHARELLEQASQPLVGQDAADSDAIEGATVTSRADSDPAISAETTAAEDPEPNSTPVAADNADAESNASESAADESAAAEFATAERTADESAVADSSSPSRSDEVAADADEPAELSADITPDSADAEPIIEDIVGIDEQAESSVAEVDFETPEQDKIAEQKAG